MNKRENRISHLEDGNVARVREKKDVLKIARDHEKSLQQVQDERKKRDVRLTGVSEKTGDFKYY